MNKSQIEELENSSEVLEIFPVRTMKILLDSSVPVVSGNSVWKKQIEGINLTGTEETVCVLDTGVDFDHPDLVGKNLTCIIDCISKDCAEDCSMGDWHEHGTHVSGIIASHDEIYSGISPGTNLIGVSVLNSTGGGSDISVAKGID
ncbi:MAG: S8 family serine peptidase, partial [Bacteroidales bacterium]|nr:S8 family serine peptidase [Bacteroidales bacterium]